MFGLLLDPGPPIIVVSVPDYLSSFPSPVPCLPYLLADNQIRPVPPFSLLDQWKILRRTESNRATQLINTLMQTEVNCLTGKKLEIYNLDSNIKIRVCFD